MILKGERYGEDVDVDTAQVLAERDRVLAAEAHAQRARREAMSTWMPLRDLRPGAIFETRDGIRAVKSEYLYPWGGIECVLLDSGEYAHFHEAGVTDVLVRRAQHDGVDVRELAVGGVIHIGQQIVSGPGAVGIDLR